MADWNPEVSQVPDYSTVDSPGQLSLEYDHLSKEDRIGQGGSAHVFQASVQDSELPIALKEPRLQGTLHKEIVDQFMNEAERWSTIDDHDHIVGVVDWSIEPLPWIALEYMDGGNLRDRLDNAEEQIELEEVLWIGICLCRAIRHAHRHGVVHLDLKPSNVLFRQTPTGSWDVPKVTDWGLAAFLIDHSGSVDALTPKYAAPEQFDTSEYDEPNDFTDIYQLGCILYELLTGQPPFQGNAHSIMNSHLSEEPTAPTDINPELPSELDSIVLRALSKEQDERQETTVQLRKDLQTVFESVIESSNRSTEATTTGSSNNQTVDTSTGDAETEREDGKRNFVLREGDEDESSVFEGNTPRQAAQKAARQVNDPAGSEEEAERNSTEIELREKGTNKVHIYDAWAWEPDSDDDKPEWMPDPSTRGGVSKKDVKDIDEIEEEGTAGASDSEEGNKRNFALHKGDEDGEESSVFSGNTPRQAAHKAARQLDDPPESEDEAERNPTEIRLREKGTGKVHIYDAWAWERDSFDDRPDWMPSNFTEANVSKKDVKDINELSDQSSETTSDSQGNTGSAGEFLNEIVTDVLDVSLDDREVKKFMQLLKGYTIPTPSSVPLRFPIEEVISNKYSMDKDTLFGTVRTGKVNVGDDAVVQPEGVTGTVDRIQRYQSERDSAEVDEKVELTVAGVNSSTVDSGSVLGHVDRPPAVSETFVADIVVLDNSEDITSGYTPTLHAHTAEAACALQSINEKFNPTDGHVIESDPEVVRSGETATVTMEPQKPLVLERFLDVPQLGLFTLRHKQEIAIGAIRELNEIEEGKTAVTSDSEESTTGEESSDRVNGVIDFLHDTKGYGFIQTEAVDDDVFFHLEDVGSPDFEEGQEVKFEIEQPDKGPRAVNMKRI